MPPTPQQLRMARAALGWSLEEVARASGLAAEAAGTLERDGIVDPGPAARLAEAYAAAGLVFVADDATGGPGVRLRAAHPAQGFVPPDQLTTENDD